MASFIYRQEIDILSKAITQGVLAPGEKLLSVREFSRQRNIGASTASRVYSELEAQGLIVARARSGYFVTPLMPFKGRSYGSRSISASELKTLPLERALQFSFNEESILPLSCTGSSTVLDNEALLNQMHRKALRKRPYRLMQDNREEGLQSLREALAKHYLSSGQTVDPAEILITHGRSSALSIALSALNLGGQTVATEAPGSLFLLSNLQRHNQPYIAIPMQASFSDELALLEQARLERGIKAYVFNPNFNDPTGRVLSISEKQSLLEWAQEHDIALIEFDRSDLNFTGERPPSCASLLPEGSKLKVISLADFSDTVSFASSVGYMVCRNCVAECLFTKSIISEASDIATQTLYTELLNAGHYRRLLRKLHKQMWWQYQQTVEILQSHIQDAAIFSPVSGGPCIWVALPKGLDSEVLWQRLMQYKISIAPGRLFLPQQGSERYFRMTFALPWDLRMKLGLKRLGSEISVYINQEGLN